MILYHDNEPQGRAFDQDSAKQALDAGWYEKGDDNGTEETSGLQGSASQDSKEEWHTSGTGGGDISECNPESLTQSEDGKPGTEQSQDAQKRQVKGGWPKGKKRK